MAVCAEAERKKECVGDRDAGESGRCVWVRGGLQRGAVVMSHLLHADRMAARGWHVPRTLEWEKHITVHMNKSIMRYSGSVFESVLAVY